jgi:hypothetical protein
VKVWYDPVRDLGTTTYPTYGFIYQNAQAIAIAATTSKLALAQNAAVAMAASPPTRWSPTCGSGASPFGMLSQMADSGDRIAALIAAATSSEDNPEPAVDAKRRSSMTSGPALGH